MPALRAAPVLLEQVVDDRLLLSVDPPGEQQAEEREGWRQRIHRGSVPDALPRFKSNVDWAEFPEERPPPAASIPPFYRRSDVGGIFALDGRWRSGQPRLGRPPIPGDVRALIQKMHRANPFWGAPHIHGELQKLGIAISETTVAKYLGRRPSSPSPTWRTFLRTHLSQCASMDFFTVPTATFRVLFVLVILSHDRRRVVHVNVTDHPTAAWTRQQIREAFPDQTAPGYLVRDRDCCYGPDFRQLLHSFGTEEILIAPRAPWQNPFVERLIGTLRRECLDHVIVWNERSLRRTLRSFLAYYHQWRPHLALDKDAPIPRAVQPPAIGAIIEVPHGGGLQHHYERRAA